jgi:hypothetical protein
LGESRFQYCKSLGFVVMESMFQRSLGWGFAGYSGKRNDPLCVEAGGRETDEEPEAGVAPAYGRVNDEDMPSLPGESLDGYSGTKKMHKG